MGSILVIVHFLVSIWDAEIDKPSALASVVNSTHCDYTFLKTIENHSVNVLMNVIVFPLKTVSLYI